MRIIGVDCAVAPEKTGIAIGRWNRAKGSLRLEATERGSEERPPVAVILEALEEVSLIAMDAPLGWPRAFGEVLAGHEAGGAIEADRSHFFRRLTDDEIARRLGKRPMDVAADRIGRTAFAALEILAHLRSEGWRPLTLAWRPDDCAGGVRAIETYPAGLLKAAGLPASGYKGASDRAVREEILAALSEEMEIACPLTPMLEDPDQLDAAICCLGAADFLSRRTPEPEDMSRARKEGWIWVRQESEGE